MIDQRLETVTDRLRKMRDLSGELHEILAPEIVSYEIVRGDIEKKRMEMKLVDDQKAVALLEIEKAKETAALIVSNAREEAKRVSESVKNVIYERLGETNKLFEAVKEFVGEADKKRYLELRKQAERLEKQAA